MRSKLEIKKAKAGRTVRLFGGEMNVSYLRERLPELWRPRGSRPPAPPRTIGVRHVESSVARSPKAPEI